MFFSNSLIEDPEFSRFTKLILPYNRLIHKSNIYIWAKAKLIQLQNTCCDKYQVLEH